MGKGHERAPAIRRARGEVDVSWRPAVDGEGKEIVINGQPQYVTGERVRSRLDGHLARRQITRRQHLAGTRFADCVERMTVPSKSCLNRDVGDGCRDAAAHAIGARVAEASNEFRHAVQAIGLKLTSVLMWVAVEGKAAKEWAEKAGLPRPDLGGITVLRIALDALADYYGLDSDRSLGL